MRPILTTCDSVLSVLVSTSDHLARSATGRGGLRKSRGNACDGHEAGEDGRDHLVE